jgi:hypothetical protein
MNSFRLSRLDLGRGIGIALSAGMLLVSACTTPVAPPQEQGAAPLGPLPELITLDQALTVEAAYQAIPHQRTPFSPEKAVMDGDTAQRLGRFFELTDMAVVERVASLKTMRSGNISYYSSANYNAILSELEALALPAQLNQPKQLVIEAIQEQKAYFEAWYHSGNAQFHNPQHGLVQSSHSKLIQAYNQLMAAYPSESHHNQTAFFDHLCALDFI